MATATTTGEQVLYREFSRVSMPGQRREIVADTSVIVRNGRLIHRIHSATTPDHHQDVPITGIAVIDAERVMSARLEVMQIDFPSTEA